MDTRPTDDKQRAPERLADAATAWRDDNGTNPQRWEELEAAAAEFLTADLRPPVTDARAHTTTRLTDTDGPEPGFERLLISYRTEIAHLREQLDTTPSRHDATTSHTPNQSTLCPASGHQGLMHPTPGTDDWTIECPTCHTWWHGGSTTLTPHNQPQ